MQSQLVVHTAKYCHDHPQDDVAIAVGDTAFWFLEEMSPIYRAP
jgi:hypothetical protein